MSIFDWLSLKKDKISVANYGDDIGCWIKSVTFFDGTKVELNRNSTVVIVGANNSGKTASLRGIYLKANSDRKLSPLIKEIELSKKGTKEQLSKWISDNFTKGDYGEYRRLDASVRGLEMSLEHDWERDGGGIGDFADIFIAFLTADRRLSAADPCDNIDFVKEPPVHPIHFLGLDPDFEDRLSTIFEEAFGEQITLNRMGGKSLHLHTGQRPKLESGQDRLTSQYFKKLSKLPTIVEQGDGMRSFLGVVMHALLVQYCCVLVDEPEAFLHPPQARLLGRMLVSGKPENSQLFVATHSGHVLRGLLDQDDDNLTVVRLSREADTNGAHILAPESVKTVWSDPILRYSEVLDGLFHKKVIVCESDSDCRFYGAIHGALSEGQKEAFPSDIMFIHAGGKARIPTVARALIDLGVSTRIVTDFDVLSSTDVLKNMIKVKSGDWTAIEQDYRLICNGIESKRPVIGKADLSEKIASIITEAEGATVTPSIRRQIENLLKKTSTWTDAKTSGRSYVPHGDAQNAYDRIHHYLRNLGIFVVDVGEVEGFCRTVGNHGPRWVNQVLAQKNLLEDEDLEAARKFVKELTS